MENEDWLRTWPGIGFILMFAQTCLCLANRNSVSVYLARIEAHNWPCHVTDANNEKHIWPFLPGALGQIIWTKRCHHSTLFMYGQREARQNSSEPICSLKETFRNSTLFIKFTERRVFRISIRLYTYLFRMAGIEHAAAFIFFENAYTGDAFCLSNCKTLASWME